MTIPFFHWFFKFRKPLKRIVTLTSKQAIENSPHNKKFSDQRSSNQEESSETKFNQILFSSGSGEVEESTSKVQKTQKSSSEIIEDKISGDKSKKDMTCEINEVIIKENNSRVVGETSISKDKSINTLIQKVENIEKSKVQRIK